MNNSESKSDVVGIDLGTTNSCVGILKNYRIEIITNDQGNRTTPSYVGFNDIERLVGDAAKNQLVLNPRNTVFDAKRLIGRSIVDREIQADKKYWAFELFEKEGKLMIEVQLMNELILVSPEEISSYILSYLKKNAESFLGKPIKGAVITVPAYFNYSQRKSTIEAGKMAGFDGISILNEPTAAALAYGIENQQANKRVVLVFDLGGGTFDVSLLNITQGKYIVLGTTGNTHLGGNDFDMRLIKYFKEEFMRKTNHDISDNKRSMTRLRTLVERAKRTLSSASSTSIEVEYFYKGMDFQSTISRAKFEHLCEDLFLSTIGYLDKVLENAGISKNDVDDVVMVGGSTRICKIQALVSEYFSGKTLQNSINPDEAVAYGAAVLAASKTKTYHDVIKDIVLVDVAPLSLGIETKGDAMTIFIPRNTPLPAAKTMQVTTASDYQTEATISIYEGESSNSKTNHLLGQFDISDIPISIGGSPKIDITFMIDANGILNVRAYNQDTNSLKDINIDYKRQRLDTRHIEQMITHHT